MPRLNCSLLILSGLTLAVHAAAPAQPTVPGFARFYDGEKADRVAGGRLLLSELNCTSCHAAGEQEAGVLRKPAPILEKVGGRIQPGWMLKFLANPHQAKPGTTMPDLFPGKNPQAESAQVEALVHYLAATGSVRQTAPQPAAVSRGEQLFHQVGCIACHQPRRKGTSPLSTSVPLGHPGQKYSLESLASFLKNPHAVRPGGRMPSLNLNDKETHDIAGYFFQDLQLPPNLSFAYYEGSWQKLPDFGKLKPKVQGKISGFNVTAAPRKDNFGLRFNGFLQVPRAGRYTFFLGSDDGSRLTIDGKTVVDVDGIHPYVERNAAIELTKGPHPLQVDFFELGGGEVLKVEFQGPGLGRRGVAGSMTLAAKPVARKTKKGGKPFVLDPGQVDQGRTLFVKLGCVACHQMKHGGKPLVSTALPPPALARLATGKGCLADTPSGVPDYRLSARQRAALSAVLAAPAIKNTSQTRIARTLETFNCLACHVRNKRGGVERPRNALFATTIKEMGDEGRVPPHLDGVGDKLNDAWLKHVLDNGANDRPYMLTRMPRFGAANVGHLVADLAKTDRKTAVGELKISDAIHRVRSAGRQLSGEKALACIKCHFFGNHKATGIQSLDLLTMTRRLRKDWFIRYMLDPQRYRPGTRMPLGWPNGQSLLPDILDGVPRHQVAAVWEYLADGGKAGFPRGLIRNAIELIPDKEPIIYRNFITGVSPRGIAVGYPEKTNLAFDADQVSLRLLWHNAFIDASRHWNGRGQGFQQPLGDHLVTLPGGVPFANLESAMTTAWPNKPAREQGYRFRGYRLEKNRRPIFRYRFGDLLVEDFPRPVATSRDGSLERRLTITRAPASRRNPKQNAALWYRAAADGTIAPQKDGSFLVGKILRVSVKQANGQPPVLRRHGNVSELLVPVRWNGRHAEIVQTYSW